MSNKQNQSDTKAHPVDMVVMPVFGQRVSISKKFYRKTEIRRNDRGYGRTWKFWAELDFGANDCIFLGVRTLQNGYRVYDSDEGISFDPVERVKAALVCVNDRLAPVLVPLHALKA